MLNSVIHVDSLYGDDSWLGTVTSPVATLEHAVANAPEGAVIILQDGNGIPYGPVIISKNVVLRGAQGLTPLVETITINKAQCLIEGLNFQNPNKGIVVNNDPSGVMLIKDCLFDGVDTGIEINNANYISIHRCFFKGHTYGILINNALEVVASANVFSNGIKAIQVSSVDRLDVWRNTIYGGGSIATPDLNVRFYYKTLTAYNITNKKLQLPGLAAANPTGYDVSFNTVNGSSFNYGTDYTVLSPGSMISWAGLALDGQFQAGDMVRVAYSEGSSGVTGMSLDLSGILDSNSTVDSNNIVGITGGAAIGVGVYFSTPLRIRYNNFYDTTTWLDGASGIAPSETGGNFASDPKFLNALGDDFRLEPSSPDIDKGDPIRWSLILAEMGITNMGSWTGGLPISRENVAPFERDIDKGLMHRYVFGESGDIGAFELGSGATALGSHVAEEGYDYTYQGTETGPYATPDRAFQNGGTSGIQLELHTVPMGFSGSSFTAPYTGMQVGRFNSGGMDLSDGFVSVGNKADQDSAIILTSYPSYETGAVYVSPNGSDLYTGTPSSPYRTIERALQDSPAGIILYPGYYPSFKGVSGVHLLGVNDQNELFFTKQTYSGFTAGAWTGVGSYTVYSSKSVFSGTTDVMSDFTVTPDFSVKMQVSVGGDLFGFSLKNPSNTISVNFNVPSSQMSVSYNTDSNTYEYFYVFPGSPQNVPIYVSGSGSKFMVKVYGAYIDQNLSFTLGTGYTGPYNVEFTSDGVGTSTVSNMSITSDAFSGFTAPISTQVEHKVYGLLGATGLTYGALGSTGMKE